MAIIKSKLKKQKQNQRLQRTKDVCLGLDEVEGTKASLENS